MTIIRSSSLLDCHPRRRQRQRRPYVRAGYRRIARTFRRLHDSCGWTGACCRHEEKRKGAEPLSCGCDKMRSVSFALSTESLAELRRLLERRLEDCEPRTPRRQCCVWCVGQEEGETVRMQAQTGTRHNTQVHVVSPQCQSADGRARARNRRSSRVALVDSLHKH